MSEEKKETIIVHSAVYVTEHSNKYRLRKKWEKPNENHVRSFMPGTIIDVFVKRGEKVEKGHPLLIIDAMKMHNTMLMPFTGRIVALHIQAGDKVPKDFLMIEIIPLR